MTTNQPQPEQNRLDRLEARLDQLVTVTEALVQTTTIHQQNFERLVAELNADRQQAAQDRQQMAIDRQQAAMDRQQAAMDRQQAAIDRQTWQTEIQRIWDYLLRQSGNGRLGQ